MRHEASRPLFEATQPLTEAIRPATFIRRDTFAFESVDKYGTRKAAFDRDTYVPPGRQDKGPMPAWEVPGSDSTPLRQVRGKAADKEHSSYISLSELGPGERSPEQYGTHKLVFTSPALPHDKLMQALAGATDSFAGDTATYTKGGAWIAADQPDKRYAELADKLGIPKDQPITEKQRGQIYSAHDVEALAEGPQQYGTQVRFLMHQPLPTARDEVAVRLARAGVAIPAHMDPGPGKDIDWTTISKQAKIDPHLVDKNAFFVPLTGDEVAHLGDMTRAKGAYAPHFGEQTRKLLETYGQPGPKDRVTLNEIEAVLSTKDVSPDHEKVLEKERILLDRRQKGISVEDMPKKPLYQQRGVVTEIDDKNGTMYLDVGRKHEVAIPLAALDSVPSVKSEVRVDIRDGHGSARPVPQQERSRAMARE